MDENIQSLKSPVYQPCGGCGATEPGQRCIGCLHDFGSPSANIDPYRESVAAPAGIADKVTIMGDNPEPFALTFSFNSEIVGVLRFKDGVATFEGNADESAKIFIDHVIEKYDGLTLMSRKRNQELLEANNRYLERARTAEAKLKEAEALIHKIAEQKIDELNKPTPSVVLIYTNYRGETAERRIIPGELWFGSTEWHPEPQWLLRAYDCEKKADRDFALKDFGKPAAATPEEVWEYKTFETGRKSGTSHKDVWPDGDGWEIDLTRGRPGEGWERFDCHEELYFRRPASNTVKAGAE